MFSMEQKQEIAAEIEKLLLSFNHPEMPSDKPIFVLTVNGIKAWSWAEIKPNWIFSDDHPPGVNVFNEIVTASQHDKTL